MRKLKTLVLATAAASCFAATAAQAERGSAGQLNIVYWQAASILNPFLSGGTKDIDASSLILEPLANYRPDGSMDPTLAEEIPTVENGGVAADLRSITWKLKKGVTWSDGSAFTANDVVFSANYCMHPEGGCNAASNFADVESVEALDDHTVRVNFSVAKPFPYGPFVGATSPVIQEAQFKDCMGAKAPECSEANFGPIGTGPFKVNEFRANDVITYTANENYRDPNQPAFATAVFKGGGDAASAARSVLETGEFDYAWNLQVEPEILSQMEAAGKGKVVSAFGTSVERLMVQLTNPDPALGDLRGTVEGGPHPFLSDINVRKALSLAIDRQILVDAGYGPAGQVTCNVLPAPAIYASTANDACKTQDIDAANKLLDDAGWAKGGDGIRAKDGVRLSILYQTSTNSVRQGTQALIKQMWSQIGVETELRNIDAAVFFGGDQSSPDTFQKFFADIEMYTNNFDGTDPEAYMGNWVCSEIPSPANQWIGNNMPRFCSEEYDALSKEMAQTASLEDRAAMAKKMNDMLMQEYVMIPLIHRGRVSAHSNKLGNVELNPWDSELAYAEEWTR
ncbi:peptide ABC transporter substrate-binding protein [Maritalea porphyrae]|uniref:ABC transporter substrate-binding protein n=1 Tax=Maritalea porphyrae TaxID=880732 RepID=A0ABQ5UQU8_9HYPH|nr:peptide ABC transporter substrate-binding protein [Maritalea porphyrae]GLQ17517.1 ABC transporter substrate-binding protein [Maritalea porphyrae]